jgi:hypothetical protein
LQSRNTRRAAQVDHHPIREQPGVVQDISSDLQEICRRLSALEQENEDLRASIVADIKDLDRDMRLFYDEAMGWTLGTEFHPAAFQIRERFFSERQITIDAITKNLKFILDGLLSPRAD